jgi:hypothetical protein
MRVRRVVLTSVVVHAGAFAILASQHRATPSLVPRVVGAPLAARPPELIEIAFLDDEPATNKLLGTRTAAIASAPRPAGSVAPEAAAEAVGS